MKKRLICFFIMLIVMCFACSIVCAAEMASANGYLLVTADTACYTKPDKNSEQLYELESWMSDAGLALVYTGEYVVDANGRSWVKACVDVNDDEFFWIPGTSVKIVDVYTALENYPYYFDGFVFEVDESIYTDGCRGRNDMGNLCTWKLHIFEVEYDNLSNYFLINDAPELVYCSWTDDITDTNSSGDEWNEVKQKKTLIEYELRYTGAGSITIHTYETRIFLPDDESIAGPQNMIFVTDDKIVRVELVLEYLGGYTGNNLGWGISNIRCTVSDRANTGK